MIKNFPKPVSWIGLLLIAASSTSPEPARAAQPAMIHTYDARLLNSLNLSISTNVATVWDTMHVLTALQGLANRQSPRLYIFYCSEFRVDTDQFWFDWLRHTDGWLRDAHIHPATSLKELATTFRDAFEGLVIYDPKVPATSSLASTAAGIERLLPVSYDPSPQSIYSLLVNEMRLPVRLWLLNPDGTSKFTGRGRLPDYDEPSSGSAKIDACRWAIHRYIRTGQCAPGIAAYYIDAFWRQHPRRAGPTMHTLSNHDYFIARRAFFFDLATWGDETPNDDPAQKLGLDKQTFMEVMRSLYDRSSGSIIKVGGFTPWPFKYTSHASPPGKYDGVPTEWDFGRLISQFNGYMEADAAGLAAMANASFYQHYPLAERYQQPNRKPAVQDWKRKGYVDPDGKVVKRMFLGHYVGDYDAPSWLYKAVPAFFQDPARGKVPLAWAFNPNLADRAPQALVYAYRNATTNDFFIAGDSGAGYLNPLALTIRPDTKLPSGLAAWSSHCQKYFQRWDMSITGFVLDGASGASTEREFAAYRIFSPDGAGTHFDPRPAIRSGIPTCPERDLPDDVKKAAALIAGAAAANDTETRFFWARSILKPPSWYAELSRLLEQDYAGTQVTTVDPYTFFGLVRIHLEEPK